MDQPTSYQPLLNSPAAATAVTPLPASSLSASIPILPRLKTLDDATDGSTASNTATSAVHTSGVASAAHTAPPLAQSAPAASSSSSAAPAPGSSHSALKGREADKRPAPKGLYDYTATDGTPTTAAPSATPATSTSAAATGTSIPAAALNGGARTTHSPPSRPSSSSSGSALVAFHRQLTAPHLYGDEEAIRIRAEIESHYVLFLRCWQQRAAPHIQQTTGAVRPLIEAHSQLQQTFNGQYAVAVSGDSKEAAAQHGNHAPHSGSHASSHATPHHHSQQRHVAGHEAARAAVASPGPAGASHNGSAGSSEARRHRDDALAAAVDEVRKSVRKRRPRKLLAEDDDDGEDGVSAQASVKRVRQGERRAAEESIAEERPQTASLSSGRVINVRRLSDVFDDDVVVVEDPSSQSEHSVNRPRRNATATRKRDVLLAHHFFRHFSLRCYSISNPPQPPPSHSAAPPNCSASVNYRLYAQSQAMLKAQFPKIGKADQPSTSYYACLCVEPVSPFYAYCASLLPPRAQPASPSEADLPIVLSAALFDLCDGLYFRILFFTSPYATNGFATLLLAHLRLLSVRLHTRLIVCATRAQKQFWLSCEFRDAAHHFGGLNFGDTMLLACELMDEGREEEQRRRMAYKSEERLKSKAAHFSTGRAAATTSRRQPTTVMRHGSAATIATDGGAVCGEWRCC